MIKNMGAADRSVRILLALTIIILFLAGQVSGTAAVILGIFAGLFLLTSFAGFCPAYYPFKFSTKRSKEVKDMV